MKLLGILHQFLKKTFVWWRFKRTDIFSLDHVSIFNIHLAKWPNEPKCCTRKVTLFRRNKKILPTRNKCWALGIFDKNTNIQLKQDLKTTLNQKPVVLHQFNLWIIFLNVPYYLAKIRECWGSRNKSCVYRVSNTKVYPFSSFLLKISHQNMDQ